MSDGSEKPDKYTAAYCIQQVRGFLVNVNGFRAEVQDQNEVIDKLSKRVSQMETERASDMAKIGELHGRLENAAKEFAQLSRKFDELKNCKKVPA
jgi:predicted transcriptional regulator